MVAGPQVLRMVRRGTGVLVRRWQRMQQAMFTGGAAWPRSSRGGARVRSYTVVQLLLGWRHRTG
ncbi:hypothetical protein WQ59_14695 [Streptomyces sp. KE1]|nr:hypothetical protein WQ59_14695 [Streptomyces sp. KE1]